MHILNIFSNRELALIFWATILIALLLIRSKGLYFIHDLINNFFVKKIFIPFGALLIYIFLIAAFLNKIRFWDLNLLKDTIYWFLSIAFVLFFRMHKVNNLSFFKNVLKDNIKLILILEFLLNCYTFSLFVEIILVLIISLISISIIFTEKSGSVTDNDRVLKLLRNLLNILGFILFAFVIYKTIQNYKGLFSISNLKSLLLPIIFTLFSMPFFYILALYIKYDSLFITIDNICVNIGRRESLKIKLYSLFYANFSLKRIQLIRNKICRKIILEKKPKKLISDILKIPVHKKSIVSYLSKILLFNDIDKTRFLLSKIGLGEFSEWDFDDVEEYHSMTNYLSVGSNLNGIQNSISCYLIGGDIYIIKLDLVLDIYNLNEKELALLKFNELSFSIFKVLNLSISYELNKSLISGGEYFEENDNYIIKLVQVISNITTYKLIIESKQ